MTTWRALRAGILVGMTTGVLAWSAHAQAQANASDAGPAASPSASSTTPGVGLSRTIQEEIVKHRQRMTRIAALDAEVKQKNRRDLTPRIDRMAKKEVARHTRAMIRLGASKAAK